MGITNRQDAPEHDEGTTPCRVNNVFRHCIQLASPDHRSAKCRLLLIALQQPALALKDQWHQRPTEEAFFKAVLPGVRPLQGASSAFKGKWHREIPVSESHLRGCHHALWKM